MIPLDDSAHQTVTFFECRDLVAITPKDVVFYKAYLLVQVAMSLVIAEAHCQVAMSAASSLVHKFSRKHEACSIFSISTLDVTILSIF